jgi:hypothetical protein
MFTHGAISLISCQSSLPDSMYLNTVQLYNHNYITGHGALNLATHYPDRSLALISLAGWIKKEDYGDSNLFFRYLHRLIDSHLCLHPLATSSATLQLYCGINFKFKAPCPPIE